MFAAPSQPHTFSSAQSSLHWRHLFHSSGLCTPRLGWSSLRPQISVSVQQLFSVFAVQSVACRSYRRHCCWTPCCFRVCDGKEQIHERLSEVSAEKVCCVHFLSESPKVLMSETYIGSLWFVWKVVIFCCLLLAFRSPYETLKQTLIVR